MIDITKMETLEFKGFPEDLNVLLDSNMNLTGHFNMIWHSVNIDYWKMEINKTMGINIDLHRSHDIVKRKKLSFFAFFIRKTL